MHDFTTPDGLHYQIDCDGVIHQLNPEPFLYNPEYVSTYDHGEYAIKGRALNLIRTAYILEMYSREFHELPRTVFDFGCGNGAFGKVAGPIFDGCFGYDILDYPLPCEMERSPELMPADIYTFWDSLEHCPDIDFIEKLECKMVVISLPWCHFSTEDWFNNWKHRKPNEHIHHFNPDSLRRFMDSKGWQIENHCNIEDAIRLPIDEKPNILTATFTRNG